MEKPLIQAAFLSSIEVQISSYYSHDGYRKKIWFAFSFPLGSTEYTNTSILIDHY
jgi:hypothetical protein